MNIEDFLTQIEDKLEEIGILDEINPSEDNYLIKCKNDDIEILIEILPILDINEVYFKLNIFNLKEEKSYINLVSQIRDNKNNPEAIAKIIEGILWLKGK